MSCGAGRDSRNNLFDEAACLQVGRVSTSSLFCQGQVGPGNLEELLTFTEFWEMRK